MGIGAKKTPSKRFLISDMRGGKAEPLIEAMRVAARPVGGELDQRAAGGAGAGERVGGGDGAGIAAGVGFVLGLLATRR